MANFRQLRWTLTLGAAWLTLVGFGPGLAQSGPTLSQANPTATVGGTTVGMFPLSNLASRDHRGLICTGFADTNPDHVLTLQEPFQQLTIRVDSGGNDTTLLVRGPNDVVRCGEDVDRRNPDAQIQDGDWAPGTYSIWVGAHIQGQRHPYSLIIGP
ncbi:MAG: hypothetical protein HC929_01630 [Leptolyngbyaceae cyanobacterium SM2_5_2]|nr:hypothetical protein [Leptolyngbyaceae cyanobacterium SM2_5_2]